MDFHFERKVLESLARIESALQAQTKEIGTIMLDISGLQQAVANETTVDQSVQALITGLANQITTLIAQSGDTVDPTALAALVSTMQQNASALTAAVSANTPAAPTSAALKALPKQQ
jgi:hypothetical protein